MTDQSAMPYDMAVREIEQFCKSVDLDFEKIGSDVVELLAGEMQAERLQLMPDTGEMKYFPKFSREALERANAYPLVIREPKASALTEAGAAARKVGGSAEDLHGQAAITFAMATSATGVSRSTLETMTSREMTRLTVLVGFFTDP